MDESPKEALVRALALVVVAVILFLFAAAVASFEYTPPKWQSQTAQAGAAAGGDITDNPKPGECELSGAIKTTHPVNFACFQQGLVSDISKFQQLCSPGFTYTITESKGAITVQPTAMLELGQCKLTKPAPTCKTSGQRAIASASQDACKVVYCAGGKCVPVNASPGEKLLSDEKRLNHVKDLLGNLAQTGDSAALEGAMEDIQLSDAQRNILSGAFDKQIADQKGAIESAQRDLSETIRSYAGSDKEARVKAAEQKVADAQAKLATLEGLKGDIAKLKPPTPPDNDSTGSGPAGPGTGGDPPGREQTGFSQDDATRMQEAWRRDLADSQRQQDEQIRRALQQQQRQGGGQGGGSGGGGSGNNPLEQIKKALGLGGDEPEAGNQQPQSPGSCSAKTICGNNFLYSRNDRCVDTPVQHCPYGCDGNICRTTPQQQQCPAPPPKPSASGCSNGVWQPTYATTNNMSCATSWRCVPSSTGGGVGSGGTSRPSAQLSCQPLVADVGMTLTISYGCSVGTSVGSGFNTNGAVSGSATSTIPAPPSGSNTISYGLTCTNEGLTDTDECVVQVARPVIALVANPNPIDSGEMTTIGWVTSGMKSCTVSSPQQSGFTAENESRTNVSGVAESSPITGTTNFVLKCTTIGGTTREATVAVSTK